jgi:aminoglycoside phosphotransferase family enzyme/predicted kinase
MSQEDVLRFLSTPQAYGLAGAESVTRIDTHISSVFLAGGKAWKLKRAVKLPFLDFSQLGQRKTYCEAEIRINRRTAPGLYLGLVPVTQSPEGGLALGGAGEAVDWLIEMTRFRQEDLLDRRAAAGQLADELLYDLAEEVAGFHLKAETAPLGYGGAQGLAHVIATNGQSFIQAGFEPARAHALAQASQERLERLEPLLDQRRNEGRVKRVHGDLHLGNICLLEGRPTLFDAIEFSDDFACVDTGFDFSFLLMDLELRASRRAASLVMNHYLAETADYDLAAFLPLFLSLRAAIRSHVAAARAKLGTSEAARNMALKEAGFYLGHAEAYLAPPAPMLVAVGGLSGSGKSRLAREIAPGLGASPGALVLRSDVIRKQLWGVPITAKLPAEAYGAAPTIQTFERLFHLASQALAAGHSVVADTVFARPEHRGAIEEVARRAGVSFHGLWVEASPELMAERIARRAAGNKRNASDATGEVLKMQMGYELGEIGWRRIDSSGPKEATLAQARKSLLG